MFVPGTGSGAFLDIVHGKGLVIAAIAFDIGIKLHPGDLILLCVIFTAIISAVTVPVIVPVTVPVIMMPVAISLCLDTGNNIPVPLCRCHPVF